MKHLTKTFLFLTLLSFACIHAQDELQNVIGAIDSLRERLLLQEIKDERVAKVLAQMESDKADLEKLPESPSRQALLLVNEQFQLYQKLQASFDKAQELLAAREPSLQIDDYNSYTKDEQGNEVATRKQLIDAWLVVHLFEAGQKLFEGRAIDTVEAIENDALIMIINDAIQHLLKVPTTLGAISQKSAQLAAQAREAGARIAEKARAYIPWGRKKTPAKPEKGVPRQAQYETAMPRKPGLPRKPVSYVVVRPEEKDRLTEAQLAQREAELERREKELRKAEELEQRRDEIFEPLAREQRLVRDRKVDRRARNGRRPVPRKVSDRKRVPGRLESRTGVAAGPSRRARRPAIYGNEQDVRQMREAVEDAKPGPSREVVQPAAPSVKDIEKAARDAERKRKAAERARQREEERKEREKKRKEQQRKRERERLQKLVAQRKLRDKFKAWKAKRKGAKKASDAVSNRV